MSWTADELAMVCGMDSSWFRACMAERIETDDDEGSRELTAEERQRIMSTPMFHRLMHSLVSAAPALRRSIEAFAVGDAPAQAAARVETVSLARDWRREKCLQLLDDLRDAEDNGIPLLLEYLSEFVPPYALIRILHGEYVPVA
jgi:hypothetical protein